MIVFGTITTECEECKVMKQCENGKDDEGKIFNLCKQCKEKKYG